MAYKIDTTELRKLMLDNDIKTAAELSEKADVSRNTVQDVLNGNIYPSSIVMRKLCDALNMSPIQAGSIFFAK